MIENKLEKDEENLAKARLLGINKNKEFFKSKFTVKKGEEIKDFKDQIDNFSFEDIWMLMDYDDENARKGYFEWIFPKSSNIKTYENYFECPRHNNILLWSYIKYGKNSHLEKYYKKFIKEYEE